MTEETDKAVAQIVDLVPQIKTYEADARFDLAPGVILGVQAIIGTAWWFMIMLLPLKNQSNDANLTNMASQEVVPFGWWWEQLGVFEGKYVYLSISLLLSWITYLVVSVVELVAWVFYLFSEYAFPRFWFSTVGYWGSLTTLFFGPLFAVVHLAVTLEGVLDNFPGTWTLFLLVVGLILWPIHGILHVFFVPQFLAYIDAQPEKPCVCDLPMVAAVPDDATEAEKVAYVDAEKDRANLCVIQCPLTERRCPIYRSRGVLSAEEYDVACAAIILVQGEKAFGEEGSAAIDNDDEESEAEEGSEAETVEGGEGW